MEEANASFVFLDDVIYTPGAKPAYVGGLREDQFAFLQAYLAQLPRERLVVLGLHIPLFDAAPGQVVFGVAGEVLNPPSGRIRHSRTMVKGKD
mgnify:CR=1 FL=1